LPQPCILRKRAMAQGIGGGGAALEGAAPEGTVLLQEIKHGCP
jgi:hypothetical protein